MKPRSLSFSRDSESPKATPVSVTWEIGSGGLNGINSGEGRGRSEHGVELKQGSIQEKATYCQCKMPVILVILYYILIRLWRRWLPSP